MEERPKALCPVCQSVLKELRCLLCGLFAEDYEYIPVNPPFLFKEIQMLFVSLSPLPSKGKPNYNEALEEALRIFRHSEWAQWRDLPDLRSDSFLQSLFADWCADNNFPLQETAVRKKLEAV